jgi:hypothetical protein
MSPTDGLAGLLDHLARVAGLSPARAARILDEIASYFSESLEEFVVRRHAELQALGMKNEAIFEQIARELEVRRFAAPLLSERQIRRMIYG